MPDWFVNVRNESYSRDLPWYVARACAQLEFFFRLDLTLGQRMLVRQEVFTAAENHRNLKHATNSFQLYEEAAARFIQKYYLVSAHKALEMMKDRPKKQDIQDIRKLIALDRMYE